MVTFGLLLQHLNVLQKDLEAARVVVVAVCSCPLVNIVELHRTDRRAGGRGLLAV